MKHGNTGNQNAHKEVTAESHLHIRVTTEDKARWVKTAQHNGMKLSEWVVKNLNSAC